MATLVRLQALILLQTLPQLLLQLVSSSESAVSQPSPSSASTDVAVVTRGLDKRQHDVVPNHIPDLYSICSGYQCRYCCNSFGRIHSYRRNNVCVNNCECQDISAYGCVIGLLSKSLLCTGIDEAERAAYQPSRLPVQLTRCPQPWSQYRPSSLPVQLIRWIPGLNR